MNESRDNNDADVLLSKTRRYLMISCWMIVVLSGCQNETIGPPPNVVFILIDDLGWMDTGIYGSSFYETPHIDRLAAGGMRFSQFYTAGSVCSPTRASIMTGKHPARLHITNWIGGEQRGRLLQADYLRQLSLQEVTIGEAFEGAGYLTGYIGKWHLGREGYLPDSQGFDFIKAVNQAGQPGSYFYPYKNESRPITDVPDLDNGREGEYLTDRLTDEALAFLTANKDTSFVLFLSHYAVHTPLQSKADLTEKYGNKASTLTPLDSPAFFQESNLGTTKQRQDHAVYAGMIHSMDESVGRILDCLDELDLTDFTVVFFASDNGGLSTLASGRTTAPTANLPLRAGKGWLYEGGIRAPMIVRWPGKIAVGSATDVPAMSTDFYPTLLEIARLPQRPQQHRDGTSLLPVLRQKGTLLRDTLYWHFPHYHGSGNRPSGAVRAGAYKLIEWFEDNRTELYHLGEDIGETRDLSADMPEKAAELLDALHAWRHEIGAGMPTPNPYWNPAQE